MVTKSGNGNGVGWKVATLLMGLLLLVTGALWAANTARVYRNECEIKENTTRLTNVEMSQVRQEVTLENIDDKINRLLRANGLPVARDSTK